MITYKIVDKTLDKTLHPFISSYVHISGEKYISKTIPSQLEACLVLDFNISGLYEGRTLKTAIVGYREDPFRLEAISSDNDKLMVRFSPCGLSAFLDISIHEINNQVVDAGDLFGPGITDLYDLLQSIPSLSQRTSLVETFLLERFREPSNTHKLIFRLADSLKHLPDNGDGFSLKSLKGELPLSLRQVERNFKQLTGIDIGQYRRIVRFEKAKKLLEKKSYARLTDVAYESGYYDQAHFSNDFKRIAGVTPGGYAHCS